MKIKRTTEIAKKMFKQPPPQFGNFKQLQPKHYGDLQKLLFPLKPQSRHMLATLQLSMQVGIDASAYFYIPESDDPPRLLSGMVIALFGEFPDPTTALSYFSKKEDIDKMHDLIDGTVDWNKENLFEAICDWHVPGLLELCKKRGVIKFNEICPLWELPSAEKGDRAKLQKLTNFKSKSGHELIVKQLDGPEHAEFINENWKFRDEFSVQWIRRQCKSGFAYGVFKVSEATAARGLAPTTLNMSRISAKELGQECGNDVNVKKKRQPISWIIACKYGAMGLLKTSPEWRGEGCAKACINNLAYHMDTLGITPHVYIEEDNVGSISLFEKLGYVKMHGASWIGFLPKK